jgi:hypothetical protein
MWPITGTFRVTATYPHTCFGPVTYMGIVITKWATLCLPGSTHSTTETTEEVINVLDTLSRPLLKQPYKENERVSTVIYVLIRK